MSQPDSSSMQDGIPLELWEEMGKNGFDTPMEISSQGVSMWPLLRVTGDSVRIVYPRRELVLGDIITFHRADGKKITHRICWMDENTIETIGDNCDRSDGMFPRSKVMGLVTHVCHNGRVIHVDTPFWRFYGRFMIWSNPVRMFVKNHIIHPMKKTARKLLKRK